MLANGGWHRPVDVVVDRTVERELAGRRGDLGLRFIGHVHDHIECLEEAGVRAGVGALGEATRNDEVVIAIGLGQAARVAATEVSDKFLRGTLPSMVAIPGVGFACSIDETSATRLVCEHCEERLWIDDLGDMGAQVDAAGWKVARRDGGGYAMSCRSCTAAILTLATALAVAGAG